MLSAFAVEGWWWQTWEWDSACLHVALSNAECNFQWHLAGSVADETYRPTQRAGYLILGASDKVLPISGDHRRDLSS